MDELIRQAFFRNTASLVNIERRLDTLIEHLATLIEHLTEEE